MAVDGRRYTVRRPACMRDRALRDEGLGEVDAAFGDPLPEANNLADLLEQYDFAGLVAVDADARRVVATILETGEAVAEDVADGLAVLYASSLMTLPTKQLHLLTFSERKLQYAKMPHIVLSRALF